MTSQQIQLSIPVKYITSLSPTHLSKNGPYIVAHLGRINKDNIDGQVYYARPFTTYNKQHKRLIIIMDKDQLSVYKNNNEVTGDIAFEGQIIIDNFEYGRSIMEQVLYADIRILNNTGSKLRGIHINNGVLEERKFPFFGKIAYFLFSSKYWMEKKKEFHKRSIPVKKLLPATNFILNVSKKINILS